MKNTRFLITCGDFMSQTGEGILLELDLKKDSLKEVFRYVPPTQLQVPSKGFTGATWFPEGEHKNLLVCFFNGVCILSKENNKWSCKGIIHSPDFNDLHNVEYYNNKIFIVNTGMDKIDILDLNFEFIGSYNFEPLWVSSERFKGINPSHESWLNSRKIGNMYKEYKLNDIGPPKGSYFQSNKKNDPIYKRKIQDHIHPNNIAINNKGIFLTRFLDRSIQNLYDWKIIIPNTPGHPHDGIFFEEKFWITTVIGNIIGYKLNDDLNPTPYKEFNLNIFEKIGHYGWTRGLFIDGDKILVGLTKIEKMPRYRWCDIPFNKTESSILLIDRKNLNLERRFDLSSFGKKIKIFDIIPLDGI